MNTLEAWLFGGYIHNQFTTLNKRLDQIMTAVQVQQEDLDQFATDINDAVTAISAEIQALVDSSSNNLQAGDVTALQAAVDSLKALEPPAPSEPTA